MTVTGKYKAAFLVPVGAEKVLGSSGWEFVSEKRFSLESVTDLITRNLGLTYVESYADMSSYSGKCLKATVMHDGSESKQVEQVYFQVYCDIETLKSAFADCTLANEAELFIPSENKGW